MEEDEKREIPGEMIMGVENMRPSISLFLSSPKTLASPPRIESNRIELESFKLLNQDEYPN